MEAYGALRERLNATVDAHNGDPHPDWVIRWANRGTLDPEANDVYWIDETPLLGASDDTMIGGSPLFRRYADGWALDIHAPRDGAGIRNVLELIDAIESGLKAAPALVLADGVTVVRVTQVRAPGNGLGRGSPQMKVPLVVSFTFTALI